MTTLHPEHAHEQEGPIELRHHFDDELINRLGTESAQRAEQADPRRAALAGCLEKLPPASPEFSNQPKGFANIVVAKSVAGG